MTRSIDRDGKTIPGTRRKRKSSASGSRASCISLHKTKGQRYNLATVSAADWFSATYVEARRRFREAASTAEWRLETYPTGEAGPAGEELTVDVASTGPVEASRVLIVSSGLHGVEGPFGSAVQTATIAGWRPSDIFMAPTPADLRVLFIHALNPYGFAWSRRTDSQNIDPNRNLLGSGEAYASDSSAYRRFDALLNPQRPPSPWDLFSLRMLLAIVRHGRPTLKQALVTGQYDFPQGLFFGGTAPGVTHRVMAEHAAHWVGGARLALHLDLHTGLGGFGTHKLLVDETLPPADLDWLQRTFGSETVEIGRPDRTSYTARGHMGHWTARFSDGSRRYLYACAEFGTYGNVPMLAALRAENQAHHWAPPGDRRLDAAKARLRRMFCPASPAWRRRVIDSGRQLVRRGAAALAERSWQ
jgi:hypothetical protein